MNAPRVLYHGSPVGGLTFLEPGVSGPESGCVCFSQNRAHATLYTVKTYLYPYGFNRDGKVLYIERFPGCLKEIYSGKNGYVYTVRPPKRIKSIDGILYSYVTEETTRVLEAEAIPDSYLKILEYESLGEIEIRRFHALSEEALQRVKKQMLGIIFDQKLLLSQDGWALYVREKFPDIWEQALQMNNSDETPNRSSKHS